MARLPYHDTDAAQQQDRGVAAASLGANSGLIGRRPSRWRGWTLTAFQHGAQDDYKSAKHPNVQMRSEHGRLIDRFMVFNLGQSQYVATAAALSGIYERHLGTGTWPYDVSGRHIPSVA